MTTMAMIYGLLPGWLSETCSSALLTHFGPKNRSSNWARRVHQVYPGSWNKSFKAACTEKYDGFTKKQLLEIWELPPEELFCSGLLIFRQSYLHRSSKRLSQDARWTPWTGGKAIWFKEGQPCSSGRSLLRSRFQSEILSEPDSNVRAAVLMSKKHIPDMTSFGLGSWRG